MAVKMAAVAWLQVLPVILLLGAQPSPLTLFGVGPVPAAAADRSKWHVPMPSVSVPKLSLQEQGVGLRRPKGSMKVCRSPLPKGWDRWECPCRWLAGTHLPRAESRELLWVA